MSGQKVSVIIPVYNVVSYLGEAIDSVLLQDYPSIEIVVVNDGSNAEASNVIKTLCSHDPRIVLIEQNNMGQAQARRSGIQHASGEYILFLDGDDIMLPGAISHLVDALDRNPLAIASFGTKNILEKGVKGEAAMPSPEEVHTDERLIALLKGIPLLSNGSICIRSQIARQIRFPEPHIRLGEDWITWCRLALLGEITFAGMRPVVCVRMHDANMSGKALVEPPKLFAMLDTVAQDKAFIDRLGKKNLEEYLLQHRIYLHVHFRVSYAKKNPVKALLHRMMELYLKRKLHVMQNNPAVAPAQGRIRVLHVVKWFSAGGAERITSAILKYSDKDAFQHIVLSLSDRNERLRNIRYTLGIPYVSIEVHRGWRYWINHIRLFLFVWKLKPDVMKTWLPMSNIDGGKIGKMLGIPVIWGIHNAMPPAYNYEFEQIRLSKILPQKIVCCSKAVYDTCIQHDYEEAKLEIINNGIDTSVFSHQPVGRRRVRKELGVGEETMLIGMAAECIPLKRHTQFLVAAHLFLKEYPKTQFVFCGRNNTPDNPTLRKTISILGMEKSVHLLGIRNDMADIFSALDIHTLNSAAESFGLAIAEAMACETLCVATDVGIMRDLLGDIGVVIPLTDNPQVLADAWKELIELPQQDKTSRIKRGRERIVRDYSITEAAKKYDSLYRMVYNNRTKRLSQGSNTGIIKEGIKA